MQRRKLRNVVGLCVLLLGLLGFGPSSAAVTCATTPSAGGDWPQHGGTLLGTRSQPSETGISPATVGQLAPKWTFAATGGSIQTIPIEAEGCVYLQTSNGGNFLYALNADTGQLVWKYELGSGGCHNAPVVRDGVIYINDPTEFDTTGKGPHVVALNAQTGELIYDGEQLATENNTGANAGCAAPVALFEDVMLIGITNGENDGTRTGGYAVVDATDGSLIKRVHVVPEDQKNAGFGGCSIWSGWSIDPATKDAYTGTAQPSSWTGKESELCNSLIKIDLDQSSATFGEIVGAMKGTVDDPPYIDVDFGSSPTIAKDADGRQVVAMLQKSGYVHGAYTRHMTHAWTTPVSPVGAALGNHTASASDGRNIFTLGGYPGTLFSLDAGTGLPNWALPIGSPIATNTVAYANGVVYYGDEKGVLNAVDSATGAPLFVRPISADVSGCTRNQSGGVSIARGKVFMACGPVVAAYGL